MLKYVKKKKNGGYIIIHKLLIYWMQNKNLGKNKNFTPKLVRLYQISPFNFQFHEIGL